MNDGHPVEVFDLFVDGCEFHDGGSNIRNFFVGQDGHPYNKIDIDIGIAILIKKIQLKNGHNRDYRDRSSKDIGIYISKCKTAFERIITDTLADTRSVNCGDIPLMTYVINQYGRYVRVAMYNHFGSSPLLQYVHIDFDYPTRILTDPYVCPGT